MKSESPPAHKPCLVFAIVTTAESASPSSMKYSTEFSPKTLTVNSAKRGGTALTAIDCLDNGFVRQNNSKCLLV